MFVGLNVSTSNTCFETYFVIKDCLCFVVFLLGCGSFYWMLTCWTRISLTHGSYKQLEYILLKQSCGSSFIQFTYVCAHTHTHTLSRALVFFSSDIRVSVELGFHTYLMFLVLDEYSFKWFVLRVELGFLYRGLSCKVSCITNWFLINKETIEVGKNHGFVYFHHGSRAEVAHCSKFCLLTERRCLTVVCYAKVRVFFSLVLPHFFCLSINLVDLILSVSNLGFLLDSL